MTSYKILGTRVDSGIAKNNFRDKFFELLNKGGSKIFTVNPEFVVDAFFDTNFQKVLNSSDYNSIDGIGVAWAIGRVDKKTSQLKDISKKVFTGVDITEQVLKICNNDSLSLFLLGGSVEKDTSKLVANYILKNYPKIKLVGYSSDFSFDKKDDKSTVNFIHEKMKQNSVQQIDVILVAYGHKNQEFWLDRNQAKIPARIGIGVGGTFDYLAGNMKRAPKFLRELGLEWLFRLLTQPQRIFRILKAVILFPILVAFTEKSATKV